MTSINSIRSSDGFSKDGDDEDRNIERVTSDSEAALAEAKEDYQKHLQQLRAEATDEVRRVKEETYDAQGKRFKGIEKDNLESQKRISDDYAKELAKEQHNRNELDKTYAKRLDSTLTKAAEKGENQTRALKEQFVELSSERQKQSEAEKAYLSAALVDEKYRNQKSTGNLILKSDLDRNKAIDDRTRVYNQYILESEKNHRDALSEKHQELLALKNTGDINNISPLARKKIEDADYQKFNHDLNFEREVNAKTIDAMKNQNQTYQQDVRDSYQNKFYETTKDLRQRNQVEKDSLAGGYRDLEMQSQLTQKNLEDKQAAMSQRFYQQHTSEMDLAQKKNDEKLRGTQDYLTDEKLKVKEDLELKQREHDRDWTFKVNDTRREYEKKIQEQEDTHKREMETAQFENDKKLQEQGRQAKLLLGDRVKAYEAQIRQQEQIFKEKERFLTEHYEEELDKVKRNARISEKKS